MILTATIDSSVKPEASADPLASNPKLPLGPLKAWLHRLRLQVWELLGDLLEVSAVVCTCCHQPIGAMQSFSEEPSTLFGFELIHACTALPYSQELSPWLKWLLFDAILTLLVRAVSEKSSRLRSLFEALGWL